MHHPFNGNSLFKSSHSYTFCHHDALPCGQQELLPAVAVDPCSPPACPPRVPTPRFHSPTSPLPPEKLHHLRACIAEMNQTLRTLGNPQDSPAINPGNQRQLQLDLHALKGQRVTASLSVEGAEPASGWLAAAGGDFILLANREEQRLIPFIRLSSIRSQSSMQHQADGHEPSLLNLDECTRRAITLCFGEIVGRSAELMNLFFGIPLRSFLLLLIGCSVQVYLANETEPVCGVLLSVERERIAVCIHAGNLSIIHLAQISFITYSGASYNECP
ncbi:hypothetical protein [Paenibacillus sp. PL2-23]|uniref:hypothetical protein n=1 Tax=Paenibacillus sp. PL2-23 TaxID=2100729 RepID=UPI0030FA8CB8